MIIKIKSHKQAVFGKIINYMMHNKERLFDKDKRSFAITHNLKGKDIDKWVLQLKANELFRQRHRSDSVILTHEILSWHKDDAKNITLKKMEDMAREYIQQRNPNGIYVAVPHFDKSHYHIHICAAGVEYKTGKSLRMSKAGMQKLKVDIQNYQKKKFPELTRSIVAHGQKEKPKLTEKEYQLKLRTGRETQKDIVLAMLKTCYKKANSLETFYQLLEECGIKTYERSGKVTGVIQENIKFRFNRLGFTEERLDDLNKTKIRSTKLKELRNKETISDKEKVITESENIKSENNFNEGVTLNEVTATDETKMIKESQEKKQEVLTVDPAQKETKNNNEIIQPSPEITKIENIYPSNQVEARVTQLQNLRNQHKAERELEKKQLP